MTFSVVTMRHTVTLLLEYPSYLASGAVAQKIVSN